jgi:hypothetical protein
LDFSIESLLDPDGRRGLGDAVAELIRSDRHDEAEAVLTGLLKSVPSEFGGICLGLGAEHVAVSGWEKFNTRIEAISAGSRPVTAVGIDITDHGDLRDAEGRRDQALETSYYFDDATFTFSGTNREELLARTNGGATAPWVGNFAELDASLSISGLAQLYDALINRPVRLWSHMRSQEDRFENLGAFLGSWFRLLRVHQAVKRGLSENGLARDLPVIVGTNEVAPYFTAIYYPTGTPDYREAGADARRAGDAANRAAYAKHTEDQIAHWREQRDAIRSWSPRVNPDKRKTYVEFVEASEKLVRQGTPLTAFAPGHTLSDEEFERMVQTYRHHRDPGAAPPGSSPPGPPPSGSAPPGLARAPRRIVGFGRRGL